MLPASFKRNARDGDTGRGGRHQGNPDMPKAIYCSFCGRTEAEVFYVVEGPGNAGICDECVVVASDVIQRQRGAVARGGPVVRKKRSLAEFRAELRNE
jgi:hypothetical protein